jgi:hypothetical protein
MPTFKHILKYAFILALMLFVGCGPDDNNPSPAPDGRTKFIGSWSVNNESCAKGKYIVTIGADPSNASQVLIYNFGFTNSGQPDKGIVSGNIIEVPKQTNSEGWTIEGIGNYTNNGKINWSYTLIISGTQEQCTCTYIKY